MKVLVCGATGFIGRNIAESLIKCYPGSEIIGVANERKPYNLDGLSWVKGDLRSEHFVQEITRDTDIIIQAAATTSGSKDIIERPFLHVTDNAIMNSLLLRSALENRVKHFIFFSCTVMYQSSEKLLSEVDFDPNEELNPRYFGVGWTKVYVEKMCEFYSRLGLRTTCIRHSNIYGPYDKFDLLQSHVFGATMTKVMGAKDKISVWGTGEEKRDLLYVSDLVDFVLSSIERQKTDFEVYNVGYGKGIKIIDLVRKIIAASGKDIKIENDLTKPTIPTSLALDCTKAKESIGWSPQVSIDQGIEKTMAWWLEKHVG